MGRLSKLDPNSFSNSDQVAIRHIDLFWAVDFATKTISGDAVYRFQIIDKEIEKIVSKKLKLCNLLCFLI